MKKLTPFHELAIKCLLSNEFTLRSIVHINILCDMRDKEKTEINLRETVDKLWKYHNDLFAVINEDIENNIVKKYFNEYSNEDKMKMRNQIIGIQQDLVEILRVECNTVFKLLLESYLNK